MVEVSLLGTFGGAEEPLSSGLVSGVGTLARRCPTDVWFAD